MPDQHVGMLALEDGSTFIGRSVGAEGEWVGEVVFNTSMTGYQEVITDASYWGQMVVFTCPHIGNVGINHEDIESAQPWVRAVLARQICDVPSNWRAQQSLPAYLREHDIPALSGLDTRRITLMLRDKGTMRGAVSTVDLDAERLVEVSRQAPDMSTLSPVAQVARPEQGVWEAVVPPQWLLQSAGNPTAPPPHVVVIDCGVKHNILRHLATLGARVTVVPFCASAETVLAQKPDGVLITNGPGDPEQVPETVETVRGLLGHVPMFGICLGHQIIGLACGGRIFKLPFGHHGGNHPVLDRRTNTVAITAQNHNYAIDADSLAGLPVEITHVNLFDGTIEGLRHSEYPVSGVQYHPEASPGPHDSLSVLREFVHTLAR
jgi:carbamoyl-phosphate synthase small subunit